MNMSMREEEEEEEEFYFTINWFDR